MLRKLLRFLLLRITSKPRSHRLLHNLRFPRRLGRLGRLELLELLGASCSGSPFIRSSHHQQTKDLPRIFSGSSIPMIAFRAASFRLLVDAEPMRLALLSDVKNWEDLFSASRMMRYSAARRCFRVISSNFSGRFLSSFRTSFDDD